MNEPIHVLVIEDDPDDVLILRQFFKSPETERPIALRSAGTLAAGLQEIARGQTDVVLLDLTLPDSRGEDTFNSIRAAAPSLPVIVLSGLDDERLAFAIVQKGGQDYLVKGRFEAATLLRSIRYGIERQQLVRDLETKNTELSELGLRLKTIIDSNADGMLIVNQAGVIEFANAAAEQFYGCPSSGLTGQAFGALADRDASKEICIVRTPSVSVLAEMRVAPTVWSHRPAHLVLLRDITQRRRTEDALRLYRDHLKEMVQRRTEELSQTNQELNREVEQHKQTENALRESLRRLEKHSRAQLDFVSNVSHELKTPLASIGYAVGNLLAGVAGDIPDRIKSYLTMISEDIDRLAGTIGDILDMSRIEARTLVLRQVKLHLSRVVLHAIAAVHDLAAAKKQRITFAAKQEQAFVAVDPKRFERVILNIVGNSMKFTPEGGLIEVRLLSRPAEPGSIFLTVTDNGIGIPPEHIDRVTERYYRVGEHVDGTGLGLALCKEITELHGGTLDITSPPEGRSAGTRVTVALPSSPPPTVLVVDDEPLVLNLIERQLGAHGYHVVSCASGADALDNIEKGWGDVLVADIMLPTLDGIALISRIKTAPRTQRLPIIVITGATLEENRRDLLDGFDIPVLAKPWKAEELVAAIEDTTAGRHFQREPF